MSQANKYAVEVGYSPNNESFCSIISEAFYKIYFKFSNQSFFVKCITLLQIIVVFFWVFASFVGIVVGSASPQICQQVVNVSINNTFINSTVPQQYITDIEDVSQSVNLNSWLISNGVIWLLLMICIGLYVIIKTNSQNADEQPGFQTYIFPVLMLLVNVFLFIWTIVGATVFTTQCGNNIIMGVKGWMYFTVIFEFAFCILFVIWVIKTYFSFILKCCGW